MHCGGGEERKTNNVQIEGADEFGCSLAHDVSNRANGDSALRGCKPPVLRTV